MPDRSHYFAVGGPWSADLLADWRWLVGPTAFVVRRVTAMGSLFLQHPDGSLYFLDTTDGILNRLAESADAIDALPESSAHRLNLFSSHFVRELRQLGVRLAAGQCYSWKVPPCLGGEPDVENVEPADVAVHVSILGQVHEQVRRMPDGAAIREVRVAAPPPTSSFSRLLAEIQRDCGWEHIPYDKISALALMCGPAEVDQLIGELDALDDADLADDPGDVADEYWRLRTAYSQVLAQVGEPAVAPLLCALGSRNPRTRAYAAKSLGRIGTPRAFSPIVALLAGEGNETIRLSLMEALGGLRDERAVAFLLPYLKTPERVNRGWIIRVAANALGSIGSESAIRPLSEVLTSDPDWFARLGAAEGLRKIRHPSAAAALRRALNDEDARVRAEAAAGLTGLE